MPPTTALGQRPLQHRRRWLRRWSNFVYGSGVEASGYFQRLFGVLDAQLSGDQAGKE